MTNNDWTGNKKSTYTTLGASNHSAHEREHNDYYATEPRVIHELLSVEKFNGKIWEPSCGEGHLSKAMEEDGYNVISSDLIDRGYGTGGIDFLQSKAMLGETQNIITNPPYSLAQEFVEHSLSLIPEDGKVAMFLKLTFLEGQKRLKLFKQYPPARIYVYSSRRKCAMNGNFNITGSSAACYAWFIWEKNNDNMPTIQWIA